MQVMRKEWIKEGKPRDKSDDIPLRSGTTAAGNEVEIVAQPGQDDEQQRTAVPTKKANDMDDENLFVTDDEARDKEVDPFEDDLDALLAEEQTITKPTTVSIQKPSDDYADDIEAMEGMEDMW